MASHSLSIPLESVNLDGLLTDDDFRAEARRHLATALTTIGEKAGEVAWNELQKSSRKIPGFACNPSSAEKSRFIGEAGQNHRSKAPAHDRSALEEQIVQRLREMKRERA